MSSYETRVRHRKRATALRAALQGQAHKQVKLDEALRANESALETISNLRDDAKERAAELSRAQTTISDQAQAIATFKEEHLTLMLEVAEMRGYISRTLEDDHVREFGPAARGEEPVLDDNERQHMEQMLMRDRHVRRQPPQPARRGPFRPPVMASAGFDDADLRDIESHFSRPGMIHRAPPKPKHWTAR